VPSRASRSARSTTRSKSSSDSGSRHPAIRTPTIAMMPSSTAPPVTTTPSISHSRIHPTVLKSPSSSTMTVSPKLRAVTAAKAVRRRDMDVP
jgi:hypothetical protein